MKSNASFGFRVSLVLHIGVLTALIVMPLLVKWKQQKKKPKEQAMEILFTVSLPPQASPEPAPTPTPVPIPEPAPPKPPVADIPIPDKPPVKKEEPKTPPKDIRQHNRIRRTVDAPPPKDKPLSEKEIERLLKQGARISDKTSIPDDIPLGAYYNHVTDRMYAAWQQPSQLKNLPGMTVEVLITVSPDGTVTTFKKVKGSGNELMDESVMTAIQSVKKLRPLPAGRTTPVDITITFELT